MGLFVSSADEEAKLDELLVEATEKRRTFPKQILPHVVNGLKAERKLMVGARLAAGNSRVSAPPPPPRLKLLLLSPPPPRSCSTRMCGLWNFLLTPIKVGTLSLDDEDRWKA